MDNQFKLQIRNSIKIKLKYRTAIAAIEIPGIEIPGKKLKFTTFGVTDSELRYPELHKNYQFKLQITSEVVQGLLKETTGIS